MTSTLDRDRQLTLMTGAGAGHAAGQDLGTLGDISAELRIILVIDGFYFIDAEAANLLAALAATTAVISFRSFGSFSHDETSFTK